MKRAVMIIMPVLIIVALFSSCTHFTPTSPNVSPITIEKPRELPNQKWKKLSLTIDGKEGKYYVLTEEEANDLILNIMESNEYKGRCCDLFCPK